MTVFAITRPLETITVIHAQGGDVGMQALQHQDRAASERQLGFNLPAAAKDFAFGGLISTFRYNKASQSGFVQILQHRGYLQYKGASTPGREECPDTGIPTRRQGQEQVITQTSRRFRSLGKIGVLFGQASRKPG